uniref:Uncharacterized protein n=1 Tax=Pararge aegeria TaxID=116150 RepID=S4PQ16_9NEOP
MTSPSLYVLNFLYRAVTLLYIADIKQYHVTIQYHTYARFLVRFDIFRILAYLILGHTMYEILGFIVTKVKHLFAGWPRYGDRN